MESDAGKSLKTKGAEVTKTAKSMVKKEVQTEPRSPKEGERINSAPEGSFLNSDMAVGIVAGPGDKQQFFYGEQNRKLLAGGMIPHEFQSLATGGVITTKSAGIFQLHQGEMVLDNAAVAAFTKSLDLVNMSQENAMAGMGGGTPIIVNNNNVDNSMQSSQTTSVSIPAPTRSNESTLRALQASS